MNYGEARKLKFNDQEKIAILDVVKSAQEQINKIPFSVFKPSIDAIKIYQSQIEKLNEISRIFNPEFIQNIYRIAQKQAEVLKSFNENHLYINRPLEYGIAIPAKIDRREEKIGKLKNEINLLKKEIEIYKSKENSSLLEINSFGNFIYKGKFLKISADSNSGKFLKKILEDKNHFISDEYCQSEFKCPTSKEITYIIRDLNKIYLSKDNLKAKLRRCRDAKGYILEGVAELKS